MIRFWKSLKSLKSSRPPATPPTAGVDEVSTEAVAGESLPLGVNAVKRGHEDLQPPPPQQQQQEKRSKGSSDEQQDQERVNEAMADIEEKITSCKKSIVDYGTSVVAMEDSIRAMQEEVQEIKTRIGISEAAFAQLESLGEFLPKNTFLMQALRVHESTENNDRALRTFLAEQKVDLRNKEKYLAEKENHLAAEKNRLAAEKTLLLRFDGDKARLMKGTTLHDQDSHLSITEDPFFSQVGSAIEEGDMLVFPTHIPLTKRERLYVRSAYKVIYDAAVTRVVATMPKYSLVTGTPGIGKSAFLYYAFWKMVKAKQRVFFVNKSMYFDGESVWTLPARMMPEVDDLLFWRPDLWCLVDSVDPTSAGLSHDRCSILLATSPRRDILKEFKKLSPEPVAYYMPIWSYAELNSIAGLYQSPNWTQRFEALGGIPRYVLEQVSQSPEQLLRYACSTNDCYGLRGHKQDESCPNPHPLSFGRSLHYL